MICLEDLILELINVMIAWIDQEEERRRLTIEALADVDAGLVIDHQSVQAWADSLESNKPLPVSQRQIKTNSQLSEQYKKNV